MKGVIDPAFRNGPALAGILKQAHHKHDEQPVEPEEKDQSHDPEFDIEVKLVLWTTSILAMVSLPRFIRP
jgi:hypothetical protein